MIELPVRQQKYQWSCTLDCACAAIEALTGEYVDTDELIQYIPKLNMSHHYYVDLPPEIKKKTRDTGEKPYNAHYNEFSTVPKAVRKVSGRKVTRENVLYNLCVSNIVETKFIDNPMFPNTKNKFFSYVKKAMKEGLIIDPGLDRTEQNNINKKIPPTEHAVLIRDFSKKDGTVEILDVNYKTHGLEPFYWVPYEWLNKNNITIYRKSSWKPKPMEIRIGNR